jgi:cell division protein FtsA
MENSGIIVGLDIGTTKIAAIVGREMNTGKWKLWVLGRSESLGVMRGMVANIEKTVASPSRKRLLKRKQNRVWRSVMFM